MSDTNAAQTVPTNGFITPPALPQGSTPTPNVPPAGPPPRDLSGEPIRMSQNPVPTQKTADTPAAPQKAADLSEVLKALQALQAKPAPAEEAPSWLPSDLNKFDVSSIEDPIIRSMASVLQFAAKDLDVGRVLSRAIASGDVQMIDFPYIAEKGGQNAQQIAEISKSIVQAINAKSEAITSSVYAAAGGQEQWSASAAAFNQSAPKEIKLVVQQMLDSQQGDLISAGAKIVAEYGKSSGLVPNGAPRGSDAAAGYIGQALSKQQFQSELRKLDQRSPEYQTERDALFQRRASGKRQQL